MEVIVFKLLEGIDPCLIMSKNVICLLYVDDILFYAPKMEYIDKAIQHLREQGMDLEVEGEVAEFLGVHMNRNVTESTITFTQSGLIKQVIKALLITYLAIKQTPATAKPLTKDELGEGEPSSEMFS
jgi:hypothetical protein